MLLLLAFLIRCRFDPKGMYKFRIAITNNLKEGYNEGWGAIRWNSFHCNQINLLKYHHHLYLLLRDADNYLIENLLYSTHKSSYYTMLIFHYLRLYAFFIECFLCFMINCVQRLTIRDYSLANYLLILRGYSLGLDSNLLNIFFTNTRIVDKSS